MLPRDVSSSPPRDFKVFCRTMDASPQTLPHSVPLVSRLLSIFLMLLILLAPGDGEAIVVVEVPENVHSLSGEGCIHIFWDSTNAETYKIYRRTATTS